LAPNDLKLAHFFFSQPNQASLSARHEYADMQTVVTNRQVTVAAIANRVLKHLHSCVRLFCLLFWSGQAYTLFRIW